VTHFFLSRHGETVWHAENRYAGSTDVALTERGLAQADALARWASSARLDAVLCSPLSRARRTACPSAKAAGLPLQEDDRLREVDFGKGEGLTRAEMREAFPDRLDAFLRDPVAHHLPGGEDPRAAAARASSCLADVARRLPDARVLVVAHSTLLRLLLCHELGVPLSSYRRVFPTLGNGTLTELRLCGGQASLLRFNAPLASF
jgi:broad specificity phosphatase PhoE